MVETGEHYVLNKISQAQNNKHCMFLLIFRAKNVDLTEAENRRIFTMPWNDA